MHLGLRGRFVAFVSAIIIAFGVVLTALAVRTQNERLRHELEERGKLLTVVIAANSADPLALLDIRELRNLIDEVRGQENVAGAFVFDEDGRLLTDGTVENPLRHELIDEAVRRHVEASSNLLVQFSGDVMMVTKPVVLGDEPLGGVQLSYSLAGLDEDQAAMTRRTTLVSALFALLGVLAAALLTEAVTKPLREVIEATGAVSKGELPPLLPVRTGDEVGELAAAFNDMTRRLRETTVSRDELDLILGTMGECLVVTGVGGTIDRVNAATCEFFGADESQLVGRHVGNLFRAPEGYASLLHTFSSQGPVYGLETELIKSSGSTLPVMLSIAPLVGSSEEPKGYVVVAADISERLRVERQKDEFITMVHHEVRTPLTAVRGAIGLLDGGVAGDLGKHGHDLVDIALRNSERMERLVNDILATRKLDSGRMDFRFERVELNKLVEQAVETTSSYADQHGVGFVTEGDVGQARVRVDPDRLIQVFSNVLTNAIRFSPPDGVITVTTGREDDLLRVAVADQGPGIPEDFRDHVFEKFARADDPDWRHRSGTGLGMSISKAIVEELGGDISFTTEVGVGTVFFVDLPEA